MINFTIVNFKFIKVQCCLIVTGRKGTKFTFYLPKVCIVQPIYQCYPCLTQLLLYWPSHCQMLFLTYYNDFPLVSWLPSFPSIICIVTLKAQQPFLSSEQLGVLAGEPWVWVCLLLVFHHRRKEWEGPVNPHSKILPTYVTFCFEIITDHTWSCKKT